MSLHSADLRHSSPHVTDEWRRSGVELRAVRPASAHTLRVDRISTQLGLEQLETDWIALDERVLNRLPFRSFEWTAAWWAHFAKGAGLWLRDELAIHTLRDERGELVGVAPLVLTHRPALPLLHTRCLQFIGADRGLTELRGPLWAPSDAPACMTALQRTFSEQAREWDWVLWSGLRDAGEVREHGGRIVETSVRPHYTVALEGDWDRFKAELPRNTKEALRKCTNSLKRDGLRATFDVVTEGEALKEAIQTFFRLHTARASAADGAQHADYFDSQAHRDFLVDVCQRFEKRGVCHVFQLKLRGEVVATRIGFVQGRSLYLFFSGFEPALGRYSVMTTLMSEIIQFAFQRQIEALDLSVGLDRSKARWRPREEAEHDVLVVAPHLRGRLAHATHAAAVRAGQRSDIGNLLRRVAARYQ